MDLAEHSCFIYWRDYKSNWVTPSQTKCWFLVRGENRSTSTHGETSQSREENQQTQPKYDSGSGKRTRATLMEDDCSHHCTNACSHHSNNPALSTAPTIALTTAPRIALTIAPTIALTTAPTLLSPLHQRLLSTMHQPCSQNKINILLFQC